MICSIGFKEAISKHDAGVGLSHATNANEQEPEQLPQTTAMDEDETSPLDESNLQSLLDNVRYKHSLQNISFANNIV